MTGHGGSGLRGLGVIRIPYCEVSVSEWFVLLIFIMGNNRSGSKEVWLGMGA